MNDKLTVTEKSSARGARPLRKITLAALFAALVAAGAFVAIPVGPVPIVLQNLFAVLSGLILGPLLGGAAVGLYLLAGAVGFPVFAGATGGFAHFAGPTGGYLPGYLLAAVLAGLIAGTPREGVKTSPFRIAAAVFAGFLILYVPGVSWLKISRDLSWGRALAAGFVPFVIGDILKAAAACLISPRLRRVAAYHLSGETQKGE